MFISAVYSSAETALFSLQKHQRNKSQFTFKIVLVLNAILIGNNISLTLFSELMNEMLLKFSWYNFLNPDFASFITVAISTMLIVVFGESIPKNFGLAFPQFTAKIFLPIVNFTKTCLYIFIMPMSSFIEKVIGNFGSKNNKKKLTEREIRSIIQLSYEREVVNPREKKLIDAVINLYTKQLRFYMVPRRELITVNTNQKIEEAIEKIKIFQISKILVIQDDNIDSVIGYISIESLMKIPIERRHELITHNSLIIKPITMIPKTKRLIDALNILQSKKQSLVLVTDEYGGTDGVLTINALLRELFLFSSTPLISYDRSMDQNTLINSDGEDGVNVNANRSNIRLLRDIFKIEKPFEDDEESVGNLIITLLDRFPYEGEEIVYRNLLFTVKEMKGNGIKVVNVKELKEASSE